MQSKLQVRKYKPDDLTAVAQLFDAYRQFYEEPSDLTLALEYIDERIKNNESVVLVSESSDGTLNGFCQLYPTFCSVLAQPVYVLYDLYVVPSARGHGVATNLLDAAVATGKENGKARLDLSTAQTNTKAQSVYEAHGWVRDNDFLTYSYSLR